MESNFIPYFMCNPAVIYLFKVNDGNTRTKREICSKLAINIPERPSGVFIIDFRQISHIVLVFSLLTLSK